MAISDFEWDEGNVPHIAEHGVEPEEAEQAVMDPMAVTLATGYRKGEYREEMVGMTRSFRPLFVVVTPRGERYRVVSARKPTRRELRQYLRR